MHIQQFTGCYGNIRAEVIMLIIPCIILFRISCNSSAISMLALFSKLFSRSLSGALEMIFYCKAHDYSIRIIIIQPTSLKLADCSIKVYQSTFNHLLRNLDVC